MILLTNHHNYKPNKNKNKILNRKLYFNESDKLINKIIQIITLCKHLLLVLNFDE
jgi:hypothetical protein